MKKECMELFKKECVKGKVYLYGEDNIGCIKELENATIEDIVEELKIAFHSVDYVTYESDKIAMDFRRVLFEEEYAYEMIIFYEMDNLMKGAQAYEEEDSRTHLYANVIECVNFMKDKPYITEMTIVHQETFLIDEEFDIKISDVDEYGFSIEVMEDYDDFSFNYMDFEEWDNFFSRIYKRLGV